MFENINESSINGCFSRTIVSYYRHQGHANDSLYVCFLVTSVNIGSVFFNVTKEQPVLPGSAPVYRRRRQPSFDFETDTPEVIAFVDCKYLRGLVVATFTETRDERVFFLGAFRAPDLVALFYYYYCFLLSGRRGATD